MREVTDAAILEQLEGNGSGLREVTDPSLLAQLEAPAPVQRSARVDEVDRTIGRTGRSLAVGAASLMDAPRIITNPINTVAGYVADAVGAEGARDWFWEQANAPYYSDYTRGQIDKVTRGAYAPRNDLEKGVDFASEFMASMVTPAALQKIGSGGANALVSAGDKVRRFFAKGDGLDSGAQRAVSILIEEGKTPEEIIAIAEAAKSRAVPTTLFEEAGSPKGLSMQRALAEQPNKAGSSLTAFNLDRVAGTVPKVTQGVATKGAETTSSLVAGGRIKEIANEVIKDAMDARSVATKPLYEAQKHVALEIRTPGKAAGASNPAYLGLSKPEAASPDKVTAVIDKLAERNPAIAAAVKRVDTDPALQQLLKSEGIKRNSAGYMEKVRGELSRVARVATADVTKLDKQAAAGASNGMKVLDRFLEKRAPGIVAARAEFAAMSPEVSALQKGIVGRLAMAKSPQKAADMLLAEAPETIRSVRDSFLKKDPQAWRDFTASMLSQKAALSEDSLAKYLASVDRALVRPKIKAMLTPSQYKAQRLLVANLRAIQKGLPRNSETVSKLMASAELQGSGLAEGVVGTIARGRGAAQVAGDLAIWLTRGAQAKISAQSKLALSQAIMNPDIEAIGKALAKVRPGSKDAIKIVESYMLPYIAASGELPKVVNQDNAPVANESKPLLLPTPAATQAPSMQPPPPSPATPPPSPISYAPIPRSLEEDEGRRHVAYMDTTGNKTVGIGFNMDSGIAKSVWSKAGVQAPFRDVYDGKVAITDAEAEALARTSYAIAREDAEKFVGGFRRLSPNRQEALMNLSYQMGYDRLSGFKKFRSALEDGDFRLAARELILSDWYEQTQPSRSRRVIQQIMQG